MKIIKASVIFALCLSLFALTACGSTASVEKAPIKINSAPSATETPAKPAETASEPSPETEQTALPSVSLPGADASVEIPSEASNPEFTQEDQSEISIPQPEISTVQPEAPQEEELPSEKISEDDILQNEIQFEENVSFVEPEVQDAVIEDFYPEEIEAKSADDEENSVQEAEIQQETFKENTTETKNIAETKQVEQTVVKPAAKTAAKPAPAAKPATKTAPAVKPAQKPSVKSVEQTEAKAASTTAQTEKTEAAADGEEKSDIDIFKNLAVIVPSRSMTVKNNQYVDVVYPGSGWIYIGETETDPRFRYFGRKLGSSDTTFTLRSIKPGKTYLHFYKNDVLTAQYIDDYLEVTVVNSNAGSSEKATAPSYAEVVPPKPVRGVTTIEAENNNTSDTSKTAAQKPSEASAKDTSSSPAVKANDKAETSSSFDDKNVKTIIQNTDTEKQEKSSVPAIKTTKSETAAAAAPALPEENKESFVTDSSKSLLEQAKDALKAKKHQQALYLIQSYLDSANTKIDEALYVQGQILEEDSDVKNIRSAIDSYDTIIKKYPASKFWQKANKRKIYLNRFYVNIY